jgi:RNA polymerase sigma-32 factor
MELSRSATSTTTTFSHHMHDVGNFPPLSADTEHSLCSRWTDHHDIAAAQQLVRSHLRLVAEIATDYCGCGLPIEELIGEGHVGLMRAVCRFDPDCGTRFATYAVWWVGAAVQQHILHNWLLVKMTTGTSQKKVFFNLHRVRGQFGATPMTPICNGSGT